MSPERLQKIIARAGVASRREAEEMIRSGRVTVNGRVVTELGTKADGEKDHVKVDGKLISRPEQKRYILLYKPKEVMTTVSDPQGRKTVIDYLRGVKERVFPVGRLDFHSEGLVLLTNDGELAYEVSHPSHGSVKSYHVKVRGIPEARLVDKLERGITIDGKRTRPCDIAKVRTTGRRDDEGNSWYEVKLQEGRTQQIRKMFKAIGHPVMKLRRVAIGPLSDPKLQPGDSRELTSQEVKLLSTQKEPMRARPARSLAARKKAAPGGTTRKITTAKSARRKTPARKATASKTRGTKTRRGDSTRTGQAQKKRAGGRRS